MPERGVAVVADAISDGNVEVTGVESFSSLGFAAGIMIEVYAIIVGEPKTTHTADTSSLTGLQRSRRAKAET